MDKDVKTTALLSAGADPPVTDAEGFSPLQRVVAGLCGDADDYKAAYQSFFERLTKLRLDAPRVPRTREKFVATATPPLTEYVERFASRIPVPQESEFDAEYRQENVACIIVLCAHEGWRRHEQRQQSPPSSGEE